MPAESTNWSNAVTDLKISSIDIIFKDDSQTTLKVIENILAGNYNADINYNNIKEEHKPFINGLMEVNGNIANEYLTGKRKLTD